MNIDISDLAQHIPGAQLASDHRGRIVIKNLALGVAQHAADPSGSILGLAVYADGPFREIFVPADEWSERLAEIGEAVSKPARYQWIGSVQARHVQLVRELQTARELAAVASHRAWSGSELRDRDETVIVSQGQDRARAALSITPQPQHELQLSATLGRFTLFTISATVHEAPAAAVRCVRALERGERLGEPDALQAQREAQAAFIEDNGLVSFPGSIHAAARLLASPSGLFEKLRDGCAPRPSPRDMLAQLMAAES